MTPAAATAWFGNFQTSGFGPGVTIVTDQGNANLTSEDADTATFGLVWSPGRVDVSIDWYRIEINDTIGPVGYDVTYEQCLSPIFNPAGDPNNPFCQNIIRDPETGSQRQLITSQANVGILRTEGVDIDVNWTTEVGSSGAQIRLNVLASFLDSFETQDLPSSPLLDRAGAADVFAGGQFDYRLFNTVSYVKGSMNLILRHRHFPSLDHASIVLNPQTTARGSESYDIFDFSGVYDFNDRFSVRFGVDNLFDVDPPIYGATPTSTAQGETLSQHYDTLGRRAYVGFKALF
jgi:iron complex outermembrane receptor protein